MIQYLNHLDHPGEALAGGLEALDDHGGRSLHEFVAERVVILAECAQAGAVKEDGDGGLKRDGIKLPVIGLEKPGPAQGIAAAEGLNIQGRQLGARGLEGDLAGEQEVKAVGGFALAKDGFASGVSHGHGMSVEDAQVLRRESGEKGMGAKLGLQSTGVGERRCGGELGRLGHGVTSS